MTIYTKTNLHLWLLTGRCEGFHNAALNSGVRYLSSEPPHEVVVCRELLRLVDSRSDFYVLGALAAAAASAPLLRILPDDSGLAFTEDLMQLPAPSVTGAIVVAPNATSFALFDGNVAGREGFTSVSVTKRGTAVIIETDNGGTRFETFALTGTTLTIPALTDYGISARFTVGGWADGQSFTISMAQTNYPYDQMAAAIADSAIAVQLMLETGTMEAFASSVRPIFKVGALACAIMRRMAVISSAMGSTFSVETTSLPTEEYVLRQLSVDWSPIVLDAAPVTYNE